MKRFFQVLLVVFLLFFAAGTYLIFSGSFLRVFHQADKKVRSESILLLKITGIILDSEGFLKDLKKYAKDDKIKAIVIRIDSPGGVVGPSQEYYSEIKRIKKETGKPIIASCGGLAASGAYYAAVAADEIFANPGTMMGSIGVIMEFANLKDLYSWAKVKRFVIKTGPYKDSGAEFRDMRDDEKELFQNLVDEVHGQFKKAVVDGRKLPMEKVEPYADGRIFTGAKAVELGFADHLGTMEDAIQKAAAMAGIEGEPTVFEPPKWRGTFFEAFMEDVSSRFKGDPLGSIVNLKMKLMGRPLFVMPNVLEGFAN